MTPKWTLLLIAAALLAPSLSLSSGAETPGVAVPHSIRMTFGPDASTQMIVAWGVDADVPQEVQYGPGGTLTHTEEASPTPFPAMRTRNPEDCSLEDRTGALATKGCWDQPGVGFIAVARLDDLEPGTTYSYRVGTLGAWSPVHTFETAPRGHPAAVTFTAYGDTPASVQVPNHLGYARLNALATAAHEPAFHLHLGDLNYVDEAYSRHAEWWLEWFNEQSPLLERGAYVRALGNHEMDVPHWEKYFGTIMPTWTPEDFPVHSFKWGDLAVVAVNLTRENSDLPGTTAAVLDAELARHADAAWRVVIMHAGPYAAKYLEKDGTVGGHGSACHARAAYEPVFAKHGVDLVLSGHDHNYQRSHPIDPGTGAVAPLSEDGTVAKGSGVVYVVAGSGGKMAPSTASDFDRPVPRGGCDADTSFLSKFIVERAHVVVRIEDGAMEVRSHAWDGTLLDEVTIASEE